MSVRFTLVFNEYEINLKQIIFGTEEVRWRK
jgi:hypothetical protein